MPNITADKVVNHLMYAKSNVNGYEAGGKIVKATTFQTQLVEVPAKHSVGSLGVLGVVGLKRSGICGAVL